MWNQYLEKRVGENAPESELSILRRQRDLKDTAIFVSINNIEQQFVTRFEQDLTRFLRKALNNSSVSVHWNLVSGQAEKKQLYTSGDKFEALAESHPLLRELKDRLGLDYDF